MSKLGSHILAHRAIYAVFFRGVRCAEITLRSSKAKEFGHVRLFSSKLEAKKLTITPKPPPGGTSDWIGPPDPISNIRPVKIYVPPNETPAEMEFRLRQAEVLDWNHKFWTEHNSKFFKEKEDFLQSHQGKDKGEGNSLSQEEISVFYKKFLNENRKFHLDYNKEWYKKNISLLWPAFKVMLIQLRRKLRRQS